MSAAWQPIETAPRDGTAVLLAGGDLTMPFTGISPHSKVARWIETDCGMEWVAHYGPTVIVLVQGPSHWCRIPTPPLDATIFAPPASAIEAQRAETAQQGSVHESATAQPGCPK